MADYIGTNFYIKPTYIVALPEYINSMGGRSAGQRAAEKNLSENKAKGLLSKKAERKLMNAVNWLVSSAKGKHIWSAKHKKAFYFKINFITLTFPYDGNSTITERQAKRCVHAFLSYSRRYFYLRNYVWKFERTVAGQLHLHVTSDTFIYYKRLRSCWNTILKREKLLDGFFSKTGHYDANSTDVHAVYKVKDVAAYIAKYMSKSSEAMPEYKGRIWASNREISQVNSCSATVFSGQEDIANRVLNSPEQEYRPIMTAPDAFGKNKEIGQIFFMNEARWKALQKSVIREAFDSNRFHIRNNIEKPPPEYFNSFLNEFFDKQKVPDICTDKKTVHDLHGRSLRKTVHTDNRRPAELALAF